MKKLDAGKNPVPFSITGRTFSAQNKTGGKIYHYENATLMNPPQKKGAQRLLNPRDFRNPQHFENRTRNLMTAKGERKINILFISHFNGKQVIF